MKKSTILLVLLLLLSVNAFSQKVAYAVLKDSTLTFYYNDKKPEGAYYVDKEIGELLCNVSKEWDSVSNQIKTVVFDKSFKEYRPKSCSRWFENCLNLTSVIGIKENLNTSEVTDMRYMFYDCSKLTSLDVSGFNTENVTNMMGMFSNCENLTSLDVSGFKTNNVTKMMGFFLNCKSLTNLDVSGFNTEKVTMIDLMFAGCENLTSLDVSGFNTENVTNMRNMFSLCENLTSLDVSGFNTENVTDIRDMFSFCENLKTIYVGNGWNTINVTYSGYMFNKCPNLVGEKGTKYDENHLDADYAHIDGGESNPGYLTKKTK